jgi:hypothetical protein
MYFFTNYDKNILGDTFLSWYDSGKPQTFLYRDYPTMSDIMVDKYGKSDKSAKKEIIEIHNRYFRLAKTAFGYNDMLIVEVEMKQKMKLITEWKVKE